MNAATNPPRRAPVECVVTVDGVEITALYPYLKEVRVTMSRRGAAECTLILESVRTESGRWIVQDSGVFVPWKRIRIDACFGPYSEEVMRGYIRDLKADYPEDMSSATVDVQGQDESLLLDREHLHAAFSSADRPKTDGQIATKLAKDYGFKAKTDPGLTNQAIHVDTTPVKFLLDRAEANGFELLIRAGTLHFRAPQLAGKPQPAIMVYAGASSNCLSFSVTRDGHKPDEVSVSRASDSGAGIRHKIVRPNLAVLGRTPAGSEGMGLPPFQWAMNRPRGAGYAEAAARAQAKANENAWKIHAEGELDGALYGHVLLSHETVTVDGVGETYGGLYYVDEVVHTFSAEGYRQRFKLLRNATGEQASAGQANRLAAVR